MGQAGGQGGRWPGAAPQEQAGTWGLRAAPGWTGHLAPGLLRARVEGSREPTLAEVDPVVCSRRQASPSPAAMTGMPLCSAWLPASPPSKLPSLPSATPARRGECTGPLLSTPECQPVPCWPAATTRRASASPGPALRWQNPAAGSTPAPTVSGHTRCWQCAGFRHGCPPASAQISETQRGG